MRLNRSIKKQKVIEIKMTHYLNEQWFFDFNISSNDINDQFVDIRKSKKILLKHIDNVTKYMKKFAKKTDEFKVR